MDDLAARSGDPGHPVRRRIDDLIDEHRDHLAESLDGLTDEEARRSLVPSRTTLLGLLKHVTFAQRIWYDQDITGRSRADMGLPEAAEDSWILDDTDTIESVLSGFLTVCAESRLAIASMGLDTIVTGRRPHPLWDSHLHVLRELAHHCGHADILREQILAAR
ncbi:DinB family protein [uncultured Williamsia sp.]|uniref:DinB family protein n=1 Tax=uncultured Williamsia sp. TaxID=259311 RepID=UPI0026196694|nr:DinB family protein [uncultured Williamsia sp.]